MVSILFVAFLTLTTLLFLIHAAVLEYVIRDCKDVFLSYTIGCVITLVFVFISVLSANMINNIINRDMEEKTKIQYINSDTTTPLE